MRIELTIRDVAALPEKIAVLRRSAFRAVNVTDTTRLIDPVEVSRRLLDADPDFDVMTHVAAKHHDESSFMRLVERAAAAGIRKLLVVSGHPRTAFDSLAAAGALDLSGVDVDVYCVHNPFLTGSAREEEDARLARKIDLGAVRGICFQIGTDLAAIARGAKAIRSLRFDAEILGSVPVPTAGMLRRLKDAPLFGVDLPDGYFSSLAEAERLTRAVLQDLDAHDIEPLMFFDALDDESLAAATDLFR